MNFDESGAIDGIAHYIGLENQIWAPVVVFGILVFISASLKILDLWLKRHDKKP
jgi:hypothetical protein